MFPLPNKGCGRFISLAIKSAEGTPPARLGLLKIGIAEEDVQNCAKLEVRVGKALDHDHYPLKIDLRQTVLIFCNGISSLSQKAE
ncbi:hypothetical protein [Sphingobium yanoikuyae]|uniref:hypothetical protein n=1 Tax=Sphingobium yanoikuyae TaxID=13690 RepID=UPI00242F5F6D|nr:hypothetical protein [Sphingobium yanoikuyae]